MGILPFKEGSQTKRHITFLICFIALATFLFTGCKRKPVTVVETETLKVERLGRSTTVYDLAGGRGYHFAEKPVKKELHRTEPEAATDTSTIKIELLPGCGLRITDRTAGIVYTIKKGAGFPWAD